MNVYSMPRRATKAVPDKYEAILEAALSLFVTRGFHGTAVPQVAKAAGVAAGTIYHYFKGKEALVNALFRKLKGDMAQRVYTGFPTDAPPEEQFQAIWAQMAEFAFESPKAFAFIEYHHHASYLDEESIAVDSGLKKFGAAFVVRAQAAGVLKPLDPVLLMELVFGAFNAMIRAHWEGRLKLDDDAIAAAHSACWDAVRVID